MSAVLYDVPGPRARRRILVASVIAGLLLAALAAVTALRLADQGQFRSAKWAPIFDPRDDDFPQLWRFLGGGLRNTLQVAVFAIGFSLVCGTLFGVARIVANAMPGPRAGWAAARRSPHRIGATASLAGGTAYRWGVIGFLEVLRGIPLVITIFFAARVLPDYGIDLPVMWYLVIGLTAYNSVVIGEIIRSGVDSLPRGQAEAAAAIGLTRGQTMRKVLLPQAFRVMLPALISQLVVVLKDTSLGTFIYYEELLRRGNIAIQSLHNPLQMLLAVGLIYISVNYTLSRIAVLTERRLSPGRVTKDGRAGAPKPTSGGVSGLPRPR